MQPNDDEEDRPRPRGPPQGGQDGDRGPLLNEDDQDDDDEDHIDFVG